MIDFYHGKGQTRARGLGTAQELVADVGVCCATLYAKTKASSPNAAELLKKALMAIFGAESPIWTLDVPTGNLADECFVVKIDRREYERQAREDQNADT